MPQNGVCETRRKLTVTLHLSSFWQICTWQAVAVRSYPVNRKPYREKAMALIVEFICELPNGVHARRQATLKRCVILFHHKLSGITAH